MSKLMVMLMLMTILASCGGGSTTPTASTGATTAAATEPTTVATEPTEAAEPTEAVEEATAPAATEAAATEAPTEEATEAATEATTEATAEATTEATAASTSTETAAGGATACGDGERLFDHPELATEPVCIPVDPQRVIALDLAALEVMMLSDKLPVATAEWGLQELPILLPQYADTFESLEGLGYPADLERVAALQPDLILAPADTIDAELAKNIAPVLTPGQGIYENWKTGMDFYSAALNVQDMYAQMEANYDTRISELKTALGDPAATTVSMMSASSYGMSLWMPDSPPGAILTDVGLSRPEAQSLVGDAAMTRYGSKQYVEISQERLDLADADAIFYFTYAATDPETAAKESAFQEEFVKNPVWNSLSAVKNGKAFFVGGHWWRAQTYLLANLVIDDLFSKLTDKTATTPVLSTFNQ